MDWRSAWRQAVMRLLRASLQFRPLRLGSSGSRLSTRRRTGVATATRLPRYARNDRPGWAPFAMTGVLRQAQDERGWGTGIATSFDRLRTSGGGGTGIAMSFDKLGMAGMAIVTLTPVSSTGQAPTLSHRGRGGRDGFYLDEQDERDVQDFWVRGWRDCRGAALLAMVGVAGSWRVTGLSGPAFARRFLRNPVTTASDNKTGPANRR